MTRDQRIIDMLARWDRAAKQGQPPDPEELCRDCPELLPSLQRSLAILRSMSWLEEPDDPEEPDDRLSLPDLAAATADYASSPAGLELLQESAEEFGQALIASGVLTGPELQTFREGRGSGGASETARDLAAELMSHGKLTHFQVRQLARGEGGQLALGNYLLLDEIGAGGMGRVYRAVHRTMKRIVAVKLLEPELVRGAGLMRFQREVEAVARLAHPNVVTAHDAAEAGGRHYLVLEYIDGEDLSRLVARRGPLTPGQALDCLLQAARGLEYAHSQGIVHRDIKPSNLMVDRSGTVKVLDLGLARVHLKEEAARGADLTDEQVVMGTADYMAPEQAVDTRHADQLSDVYSLGCTLHFLLTGQPIFGGQTLMARILAHREEPVPSLRQRNPAVPEYLDAIFRKMVAKDPRGRYPSMAALLRELEAHAGRSEKLSRLPGAGPAVRPGASWDTSAVACRDTLEAPRPALPSAPPARGARWWAVVALASLGLVVLAGWFLCGTLFEVPTPDGIIVVELEGKPIPVKVNEDGTITVTDPNDGKAIEVKVDKGKQLLTLTKAEFRALALEFNLSTKDGRWLKAKFVPSVVPAALAKRELLIASQRTGNFEIFLLTLDGTVVKNLSNHPAEDLNPAWSPDGHKVAFASSRGGQHFDIYLMDADGGGVKRLTNGPWSSAWPSWSPDGKKILFTAQVGKKPQQQIFVVDVRDGTKQQLTHSESATFFAGGADPAWSPDGKNIAFISDRSGQGFRVYVMGADGGNVKAVSTSSSNHFGFMYPAWSPDGKKIAYADDTPGGSREVFVCDADGANPKQLTSRGGVNTYVAWSPDGKYLTFQHCQPSRMSYPAPVYVMDADSGNQRVLLTQEGPSRIAWRPRTDRRP